ncbi:glycosyltransferase family 2 protein [Psychromonas sp. PT13]|uniref:glycosyltransferase family 2 protein n=1 Tax=Psychromonas sp. PT13 TaxID=3439547 RepID=UPI003EBC55F3
MLTPDISFIVPVYNDEKYLSACIETILAQDNIDSEIIVINDGSNDKSLEIATSFSKSNDNVKVFSFENSGLSISRNRGIERASGKYIQFVDSDDLLPDNSISYIIKRMDSEQLDLYCGSALIIDDKGRYVNTIESRYSRSSTKIMAGRELFNSCVREQFIASACLYVVRRKILDNLRFFPGIYHEDNLFTVQLLVNNVVQRAVNDNNIIYYRRIRPGSITQVSVTDKHANGYCRIAEELYNEVLSGKYDDVTSKNIIYVHKKILGHIMYCFDSLSFTKSISLFVCVFKLTPFKINYLKPHLKNVYYFIFRNLIQKRIVLVLKKSLYVIF